jgi:hypothetical protein
MGALFAEYFKAEAFRATRESLFFERQRSAFQQPKGWSK